MRFGERKSEARELRAPGTSYHDAALRHVTPSTPGPSTGGLEALAAGTEDTFLHDCAVPVEGQLVWFHVQYSRVDGAGRIVVTHTDITHRVQAEEAALWRARHDNLTDLPNRAYLHELIARALRRPGGGPVTVLFMDLDGFKAVNDSLCHEVGDGLLRHVAAWLSARTRGDDVVGPSGNRRAPAPWAEDTPAFSSGRGRAARPLPALPAGERGSGHASDRCCRPACPSGR